MKEFQVKIVKKFRPLGSNKNMITTVNEYMFAKNIDEVKQEIHSMFSKNCGIVNFSIKQL